MSVTFISKGTVITNPSANNIGRAQFVRCVATAQTTVTVTTSDSTVSEVYLHAAGDEVILEKAPDDKISGTAVKAHAVGSPRS